MNILIICGETSANIYAAHLSDALRQAGHAVYSFGDEQLSEKTTQLLRINATNHSINPIQSKRPILRNIRRFFSSTDIHFDRVVIIDFPNYNFKIASIIKRYDIPIATFITPNFWIWNQHRLAKRLIRYSDMIITIFKKEYEFYSQFSKDKVFYFGHPIALEPLSNKHSLSTPFSIGIFPGSRLSEIEDHLPVMCQIVSHLKSLLNATFSVVCVSSDLHLAIQHQLDLHQLTDIPIHTTLDSPLSYAISAPGTNTLRLALMNIPMTIIGQLNPLNYFIAKYILRIRIPFVGLPNVILGRNCCPEYIQANKNIVDISSEIHSLLLSAQRISSIQHEYSILQNELQVPADYYDHLGSVITKDLTKIN